MLGACGDLLSKYMWTLPDWDICSLRDALGGVRLFTSCLGNSADGGKFQFGPDCCRMPLLGIAEHPSLHSSTEVA